MGAKHRVLIVGVGSIGERHLRCFQATGRAEVSLVEINPSLRDDVAARYQVSRSFSDVHDALDTPPDVAVIATPAPTHIPIARTLVEAGVPVLIEKPLSTSLDGVEELQAAAARRNLVVGVAYVLRCHPILAPFRAAIASGQFGRAIQLVAVSGQHFPLYRPAYRTIYYNRRETGGGAIQDALTHLINAGEWIAGPVTKLAADAAHQNLDGVDVEDMAHVIARHGEVPASYSLNQFQAPNEVTLTAVCELGTVRAEFHESRWRWMKEPGGRWHDEGVPPVERDTPFVAQAHRFLDAVEGKGEVPCTLAEGLQTLRVNLAAINGLDSGTWQTLG